MAFLVILVRGGLSIDIEVLKRLKFTLPLLAVVPILVEVAVLIICAVFLLGYNLKSGVALGFLIAAVSPAVVVPCMLEVEKKGLGQKAGITTLCIAGATLSDVLCITGFSITLGMIFGSERSNLSILLHVPVEMGLGMLIGLLGGLAINYMTKPSSKSNSVIETLLGVLLLLLGSLASLLGSDKADSHVLGPIAVLSLGFFTGYFTKKHRPELYSSMKFHLDVLWKFIFMPLLFGLIGFRLDSGMLFGGSSVELMKMCLILLVAMLCRVGTTYLSVCGPFNVKEKIFLAFAWLPKATIQAALATTFLDMAVLKKRGELVETGEGILLAAVLSIFLSAPVGQFFIQRFAGKLLQRDQEVIVQEQTELLESGGKVE